MRKFLLVLCLLLLAALPVLAQEAVGWSIRLDCISREVDELPIAMFGYAVEETGDPYGYMPEVNDFEGDDTEVVTDFPVWFYPGDHPQTLGVFVHDSRTVVWVVELFGQQQRVEANETAAPDCDTLAAPYGADGGWVEIEISDPPCNPCTWEVADDYGNWHDVGATTPVQDEGSGGFTRLVLGRDNPVTDPARYRVH